MVAYCCKGTPPPPILAATEGTEFCAPTNHLPPTFPPTLPTSTHHYSCKTKLISYTTKIMTIKNFTG